VHSALKAAQLQGLVQRNMAALAVGKPHGPRGPEDVMRHRWEANEASQFMVAATGLGPQPSAFYSLALDSGPERENCAGPLS
jgi:hypothetical protein